MFIIVFWVSIKKFAFSQLSIYSFNSKNCAIRFLFRLWVCALILKIELWHFSLFALDSILVIELVGCQSRWWNHPIISFIESLSNTVLDFFDKRCRHWLLRSFIFVFVKFITLRIRSFLICLLLLLLNELSLFLNSNRILFFEQTQSFFTFTGA